MQIRSYDEVDPYDVYRLTMAAFALPWTPKYVRHRIRKDPRVLDGFAIYAVERGRAVAQAVPLAMPVRLTTGIETVGGIQGVCSLTALWGKGYMRPLMDRAHDMFRERGLSITTLMTSRNIRGYRIYGKMGYVDLARFDRGTRMLAITRRAPHRLRLRRPTMKDLPRIKALHEASTSRLTGWTERDPRFLPMQVSWHRGVLDEFRLAIRDGEAVGYVRAEPGTNNLAEEAVFPMTRDFHAAVRALESKEKREFSSVTGITSARDRSRYRRLGYELYGPMHATVMGMGLGGRAGTWDLPRLFGATQGRFVLHSTDWF